MVQAEQIAVALHKLQDVIAGMERVTVTLDQIRDKYELLIGDTDTVWEGPAREQYAADGQELLKRMSELEDELKDRKQQLQDAVRVYETAERQNQQTVGDLSADQVF